MNRSAFTLIELLIVVAIIGILAAIAVPNFLNAQMRAKVARVESDIRTIMTAFEMYRMDGNGDLPRWGQLGWARAWGSFTTPVSYMSIPPFDVFQPKQKELFVNAHRFYEYGGSNGKTPMGQLEEGQNIVNYVVASLGPDAEDDTIDISAYPNAFKFLQYDPTNGLTSDGDYLRESKPGLNPQRAPHR